MDASLNKALQKLALEIRIGIVEQIRARGFGHIGGSLSIADALAVLYGKVMRYDPQNPRWPERDKLVCSKGHAGPAVYAALAISGFFPYEELKTLNQPGTHLPSHCDKNKTPGVDMTTGSLGQGTSLAVGIALGDKLKGRDSKTYLFVGDGESDEGQVWEAAMFAGFRKLDNLCVIVDNNNLQIDGPIDQVCSPYPIDKKFEAFNFHVINADAHDFDALRAAFGEARNTKGMPTCIVVHSLKGKGVSFMENSVDWHGKAPNDEEYAVAMADLEKIGANLGNVMEPVACALHPQ